MKNYTIKSKSKPLREGTIKSNIKSIQGGKQAPPPTPPKLLRK